MVIRSSTNYYRRLSISDVRKVVKISYHQRVWSPRRVRSYNETKCYSSFLISFCSYFKWLNYFSIHIINHIAFIRSSLYLNNAVIGRRNPQTSVRHNSVYNIINYNSRVSSRSSLCRPVGRIKNVIEFVSFCTYNIQSHTTRFFSRSNPLPSPPAMNL